ncbi:hypothetical protein J15TS10_21010 [Paenibacillus woosongensis]|uniref:Uncharacterized protein n=1 Tax=Paenibacillus woosongensis TaxID=307580 RepID=A0ABQ4MRF2_9BACL|nr:hypothetical protein J15TS10_21010 [Paenibacillus woosongensis]
MDGTVRIVMPNGIYVSNYALNACFRGLDGFDGPKIKNPAVIRHFSYSNDMKSI